MPVEEQVRPIWKKWNGVIPVWKAEQEGINRKDLLAWAETNPDADIVNPEVITWYPDSPEIESFDWEITPNVISLASAGPNAYLWGPSVVEFAKLGTWGSGITFVATPKKQPKNTGIHWILTEKAADSTIAGLPSQKIKDAIISSMRYLDRDKFTEVLEDASNQAIISDNERITLEKANSDGYHSALSEQAERADSEED